MKYHIQKLLILLIPLFGMMSCITLAATGITAAAVKKKQQKQIQRQQKEEIEKDAKIKAQQELIQQQYAFMQQTTSNNIPVSSTVSSNNQIVSQNKSDQRKTPQSDVDINIPISKKSKFSENTYVLIIANENYKNVDNVNFAIHDGEVFKEYCSKTLSIPSKQIFYYSDATFGDLLAGVDKMKYALNNFEDSKAIVYYCGHGIPDEKPDGDAYILPIDGKGTNTATCYSLRQLYTTLAATKATSVTYFMDACFTGANKEGGMLVAARGVAREAKRTPLAGNTVAFSAASADETAMTYPEKGHGLFTYFLLKKLQETKGDVSYLELAQYIKDNVKKEAFLVNEKPQTPVVAISGDCRNTWKTMTLK